jgi:hypothetical protein
VRRALLLGCALAAVAAAFFFARPPSNGGPALRDFESYYAAGAVWHGGGDPYGREIWRTERAIPGVVATREELLPFVGPAFGLPLWAALARLPYERAAALWGGLLALCAAGIAFGSLRLARGSPDALDALAIALLCATFGPIVSGVGLGQVAILSCAAIVAAIFALDARARFPGIAGGISAAVIAALQPNLGLVLAARLRERRSWIVLSVAAAAVLAGSIGALGGLDGLLRYGGLLREHARAERFIAIQTTIGAVAHALGASANAAQFLAALAACGALGATIASFRIREYDGPAKVAIACALAPLVLPFAHEHDFAIAFLPAVLVLRRSSGIRRNLAAAAFMLLAVDWLGLAQRPEALALATLLALAAGSAVAALSSRRPGPGDAWPLAFTPLVYIVGRLAALRPLPVWPDALGPLFAPNAALSATQVWQLEQLQSGIGDQDPSWGALRALSLLGAAIVWGLALVALARSPFHVTRDRFIPLGALARRAEPHFRRFAAVAARARAAGVAESGAATGASIVPASDAVAGHSPNPNDLVNASGADDTVIA